MGECRLGAQPPPRPPLAVRGAVCGRGSGPAARAAWMLLARKVPLMVCPPIGSGLLACMRPVTQLLGRGTRGVQRAGLVTAVQVSCFSSFEQNCSLQADTLDVADHLEHVSAPTPGN